MERLSGLAHKYGCLTILVGGLFVLWFIPEVIQQWLELFG
jgi:hypothetical protein